MTSTIYLKPQTLEEGLDVLSRTRGNLKVIAGGTDLLMQMKRGVVAPEYIVDISNIPNQAYIKDNGAEGIEIGAQTTVNEVASSSAVQKSYAALSQAAGELAVLKIRYTATIAGNICNASPSAETPPALLALGAKVIICSSSNTRIVPVEEFFVGPGKTVLESGELVTAIIIPKPASASGSVYIKHTLRKAMDLAIVGVACSITMDNGVVSDVKIALGAVAPTPIRSKEAEKVLQGKKINDDLIKQAAKAASNESKPIDDIRSTADYRKKMVAVLTERAIKAAIEKI